MPRGPANPDLNPAGLLETIEAGFREAFQARGFPLTNEGRNLTIALADADQCTAWYFGGVGVVSAPGFPMLVSNDRTTSSALVSFVATVRDDAGREVFSRRYTAGDAFAGIGALPRDQLVRVLRTATVTVTGDVALVAALRDGAPQGAPTRPSPLTIGPRESTCRR